jgi:hypothetical protein
LPTDEPGRTEAKATVVTEVERLRRRIWNGKAKNAQKTFDRIREVIYWLWVSGVARVREHARSGEDLGLSRRCDGFVILCVGGRNFIIPGSCEITTRSAPSQFGTGFLVDASRSGVG